MMLADSLKTQDEDIQIQNISKVSTNNPQNLAYLNYLN